MTDRPCNPFEMARRQFDVEADQLGLDRIVSVCEDGVLKQPLRGMVRPGAGSAVRQVSKS